MDDFIKQAPVDHLPCIAYLKGLDDYFSVNEAVALARAAREKNRRSYMFDFFCALIGAQDVLFDGGRVHKY